MKHRTKIKLVSALLFVTMPVWAIPACSYALIRATLEKLEEAN